MAKRLAWAWKSLGIACVSKTLPAFFCVSQGLLKQCGSCAACLHRIVCECLSLFTRVHSVFWEGRSATEEKSLTFYSFASISNTISVSFCVFVCFMLQESIIRRSEINNLISQTAIQELVRWFQSRATCLHAVFRVINTHFPGYGFHQVSSKCSRFQAVFNFHILFLSVIVSAVTFQIPRRLNIALLQLYVWDNNFPVCWKEKAPKECLSNFRDSKSPLGFLALSRQTYNNTVMYCAEAEHP